MTAIVLSGRSIFDNLTGRAKDGIKTYVIGFGSVTVMSAFSHARISSLLKYPRSATASKVSVCSMALVCLATRASMAGPSKCRAAKPGT